jgi:phosphate transport system substrate-binding protein
MRWFINLQAAAVACFLGLAPNLGVAQEIVLSAKDGDQKVTGSLIEYDGEFFRVETEFGPVTVDARTVTCVGDGCPVVSDEVETFAALGDPAITLPLIEAFSLFQGGDVSVAGSDTKTVTVKTESGDVLAKITVSEGSAGGSDGLVFSTLPVADPSRAQVIGLDAVVFATSDVNPVDAITLEQMRGILNGSITNWKDLGGGDSDVSVHTFSGDAGFEAQIKALGLITSDQANVTQHLRLRDAADAVANDPFGLAVVPFSGLRTARAMGLRGSCGMHNEATVFALQSGAYPMRYALTVSKPSQKLPLFAREFLEFLETEQAQAVIADLGFADMGINSRGLNSQGQRLANTMMIIGKEVPLADVREMTAIQSGAKLLSATFRFDAGSTRLDGPSKENAEALVNGIVLGNYADKVIYLMGFSDGEGRARQNKSLSKDRAEAVRDALIKSAPEGTLDDVTIEVLGYGEASPLVCEDTSDDAQINRRVEVWVKDRVGPVGVVE